MRFCGFFQDTILHTAHMSSHQTKATHTHTHLPDTLSSNTKLLHMPPFQQRGTLTHVHPHTHTPTHPYTYTHIHTDTCLLDAFSSIMYVFICQFIGKSHTGRGSPLLLLDRFQLLFYLQCVCMCVCVCMYVCMYAHMCRIFVYPSTCSYTHTHTHTHTQHTHAISICICARVVDDNLDSFCKMNDMKPFSSYDQRLQTNNICKNLLVPLWASILSDVTFSHPGMHAPEGRFVPRENGFSLSFAMKRRYHVHGLYPHALTCSLSSFIFCSFLRRA